MIFFQDVTCAELTGLYGIIIINEMQAFPSLTCGWTCGDIETPGLWGEYEDYHYLPRKRCAGIINGCGWIGTTTICNQVE